MVDITCRPGAFTVASAMARKRRTELPGGGESSEPQETSGGRGGAQRPPAQQQPQPQPQPQPQLQQQGGYQGGGRGWASQRGGAYGGRGGGRAAPPQQYYGGPPEYQQQGQSQVPGQVPGQGRGGQQQYGRGGAPRRGAFVGGREAPSAGGPRPPAPELHQATQSPYQAMMTKPGPVDTFPGTSSSSQVPDPPQTSEVTEQIEQLSVQQEVTPAQGMAPASSKSMRFPLRPGMGNCGKRCVVKANHFFAELPDKDLHQYDVSTTFSLKFICMI